MRIKSFSVNPTLNRHLIMVGGAVAHPAATPEPDVKLSLHPALQKTGSCHEKLKAFTEASISEKPGAVVPHAGICAGGGRVTALPTANARLS